MATCVCGRVDYKIDRRPLVTKPSNYIIKLIPFFSTFAIQTVACPDVICVRPICTSAVFIDELCFPSVFILRPYRLEVFPHSYALLTASLVLGRSSRVKTYMFESHLYSRHAVRASDSYFRFFARYKFVTYLLTRSKRCDFRRHHTLI